jgi:predicted transcriptional regulator
MIVDYDSDNYAVLIEKKKLENVGFRKGDHYYVINLDRGVIALVKKSDFKNVLKQKIRDSLGSDYNTMRDYGLTNEQIKVIDKLIGVKFEERTKKNILTSLSEQENAILEDLIKSKTIKLYDQGKYTDKPVYSVTPDLFKYVKTSLNSNQVKSSPQQPKISSNLNTSKINSLVEDVNKKGFVVAQSDNEAKMVSESLSQKIKSGQILGIKGFDSHYYIFNSKFFNESNEKIVKCFSKSEGKCSLKHLSENTGLDENICKGILMFLLEKGDIIEKPNSTYQMI